MPSRSFVAVNIMISSAIELFKMNMVSNRKKRQSNRRFLSQLDDFDQDMVIGNAASERQANFVVSEGTNDQDLSLVLPVLTWRLMKVR